MQLAERIFIKKNKAMDDLCLKQTVVYNQALWYLRQEYFILGNEWKIIIDKNGKEKQVAAGFLTYFDLNDKSMLKWKPCYRDAIPLCAANTIKRCCEDWKGYREKLKKWSKNPSEYTGKPRMPNYADRNDKSPIYFTYIQFAIKDHHVIFPKSTGFDSIYFPRMKDQKIGDSKARVKQIRVIPSLHSGYCVEAVYNIEIPERTIDESRIMAIDLGMVRIATVVDNVGSQPIAVPGGPAIAVNNWYNRELARLRSEQMRIDKRAIAIQQKYSNDASSLTDDEWKEWKNRTRYTPKMKNITNKRNNQIKAFYHRVSKFIVDEAVKRDIGIIVIGHNPGQKQNMKKDKKMNDNARQKFTQQPIFKLIDQIKYKAEMKSIKIVEITEEFTSKASFIDNDTILDRKKMKKKANGHSDVAFSGKRVKRGMYQSANGTSIQSDVNGAYNIGKKAFPEKFNLEGISPEGNPGNAVRLHPRILNMSVS